MKVRRLPSRLQVSAPRRSVGVANSVAGNGVRRTTTIHRLIDEDAVLLLPGVYDAWSAKILQSCELKAAFISGFGVSATLLGEPDLGLLTPPEMARKAGQICTAVPDLPVIADADTGGGGVLNVQRTIRQLIKAGCKGCCIEDQVWPKMGGHLRGKEVISMEEHASKISAAADAIGDADFFLIARTDARGTSAKRGLDEAITRANLYMDAGADASFVEAPRSRYELQQIGERTKGLRMCNMLEGGLTPMKRLDELRDLGFHIVAHPLTGLLAATRALREVYSSLAEAGVMEEEDKLVTIKEFNNLVGLEHQLRIEEQLLGANKSPEEKLHVRIRGKTKPTPN